MGPFTIQELRLNNGKAPCVDNISGEMLKVKPAQLCNCLDPASEYLQSDS